MKTLLFAFLVLYSISLFGQEMIGRIDAKVIQKQKIKSCTEWRDGQQGITVFYNSLGLPSYYNSNSGSVDSSGNKTDHYYSEKTFQYDKKGRLIQTVVSSYDTIIDLIFVYSIIKNSYSKGTLMASEYYDSPESKPTVTTYYYKKNLLMKKVKIKADSSIIVTTGERFRTESIAYIYDDNRRLITLLKYREANLLDSTVITYTKDTATWSEYGKNSQKINTTHSVTNAKGREIERVYLNKKTVKWVYDHQGLLLRIDQIYQNSEQISQTTFTYTK